VKDSHFNPDIDLFPYILKPGRYSGAERGLAIPAENAAIRLLLVYPAGYGTAMEDLDYLRLYFILNEVPGVAAERAVPFDPDAKERLAELGRLPFSLETHRPWVDFDYLVFFIADPLDAARIPQILRELRDTAGSIPPVAVVSTGRVIPGFLTEISDLHLGGVSFSGLLEKMGRAMGFEAGDAVQRFFARGQTPQIIPLTGTRHDELKIPLFAGPLASPADNPARAPISVARDTLLGLDKTGYECVHYLAPDNRMYEELPEVFSHLSLRANLARHHFRVPPVTPEVYLESWAGFRPHFLKSELSLIFPGGERVDDAASHPLAEAGQVALRMGWQVLVIVYRFDHWEEYRRGLSSLVELAGFLSEKCKLHEDKRQVRLRWAPVAGTNWIGPLQYDDRIRFPLTSIHTGALQRLPGESAGWEFDPSGELTRQLLLRVGADCTAVLEDLPLGFSGLQKTKKPDVLGEIQRLAIDRNIPLPEFGQPVDLSLSPFLETDVLQSSAGMDYSPEPQNLPTLTNVFGRGRRKIVSHRRLNPVSLRRLRVQYVKQAELRFFSHLDMVRMIERAIRRSRLPVAYSSGFHPRPKISFGPPLPWGAISQAEYFDLVLGQDYEPGFIESLKRQLPTGLSITQSLALPAKVMSLFERINLIIYRVVLPSPADNWDDRVRNFLAESSAIVDRVSENGTRRVDIRPFVQNLTLARSENTTLLEMELMVSQRGTVRPAEIISYLGAEEHLDPRGLLFDRLGVFIQEGGRRVSPMDFK